MAHQVKNKQGFLIIQAKLTELLTVEPGCPMGICDRCNKASLDGYLVPVLGQRWFCPKCYKKWAKDAERFPEDADYENYVFNNYRNAFVAAGLWNEPKGK